MLVIAMAYGNQPLKRLVTGAQKKLVYLLNPAVADAAGATPLSGVGFPQDAIFEYDEVIFKELCESWKSGDAEALEAAWGQATPLREDALEWA